MNEELWSEVRIAAESHNPNRMLSLLLESGFLEGLKIQLQHKWSRIAPEDIDSIIIAAAIDDLYKTTVEGNLHSNPAGYLFKAASFRAGTLLRHQRDVIAELSHSYQPAEFEDPFDRDDVATNVIDDELVLRRALQEARRLLPKLGQTKAQMVMSYVFDAIEAGLQDIQPKKIAEALNMSNGSVRTALTRGFQRLRRAAINEDLAERIIDEASSLTEIE